MIQVIERGFFNSPIRLSDINAGKPSSVQPDVQILRTGKFNHPKYGEFEITTSTLSEMKSNFDQKIRGVDVALDYFHKSDEEASGWLTEVYLSEDGDELWGKVDWTPTARKMLSDREIRYFSPDFAFQWTDPETDVTYKNVLFGGGLTNRPFVKDMAAIVASETKGGKMTLAEMEKKLVKLAEGNDDLAKKHEQLMKDHSDLQQKHAALEKKMGEMMMANKPAEDASGDAEGTSGDVDQDEDTMNPEMLKKQLGEAKAKLAEYEEKAKLAEQAKQMAERENKFTILLSEGKACVAQKDAFMKNDMDAFIKLAQPVNLEGKGSTENGGANTQSGDREDRVLKLAEEKVKKDGISMHEAILLANREIK